jgi:phage terminase small subunit
MSESRGLTPKQQRFVEEYLIDLNATAAARRAGYSIRTAEATGWENLRKPEIAAAIAAALAARSERTQIDADWVLKRLAHEAEADLADIYDSGGNLLPIHEWPMVFRQGLVAGFETVHEADGPADSRRTMLVRKIKLQDRSKTVEMIGRHVGVQAFKDRLEFEDVTDRAEQMRLRRVARLGKA